MSASTAARPDRARLNSARWAILILFALPGVSWSSFVVRLPSVRDALMLREDQLALIFIFGSIGALIALTTTGWVMAKWGIKSVLMWVAVPSFITTLMQSWAVHEGLPWLFALAGFLGGATFAFLNVGFNTEGAAVEKALGRTLMPQFHGAFSIGAIAGMAIGGLCSLLGVAPELQFAAMGAIWLSVHLNRVPVAVIESLPTGSATRNPLKAAVQEYRHRRVVLLGLVVMGMGLVEGAANQWISIAAVDGFQISEARASVMYGVFVVAMVVVRLLGGKYIDRWGRVRMLRLSIASVITGVALFGLVPDINLATLGLAFWGMGVALAVPIGYSAAADDPKRASATMAAMASFDTFAAVVMPPVLGFFAHMWTTRLALLLVIAGAILAYVMSKVVSEPEVASKAETARVDEDAVPTTTLGP